MAVNDTLEGTHHIIEEAREQQDKILIPLHNDFNQELTTLNLGPTHPATHGIFQNILQMDGERIVSGVPTIGYIHRAFEKIAERRPFYQITTLTDRMNYCSSPINNLGWHMTVEKMLGIPYPSARSTCA